MSGRSRGQAGNVMNCLGWKEKCSRARKNGPVDPSDFLPWPKYRHSSKKKKKKKKGGGKKEKGK